MGRSSEQIDAPVISSLYGRRDPAGAGRIAMSTALVIFNSLVSSIHRWPRGNTYLPRLDENPNARPHKYHPARLFVIVDEIQ